MASQFFQLKVATIRYETEDAVRIGFKVPKEIQSLFAFDPGQYLTISLTIDGERVRRAYSICSATHEAIISFLVKRVEGGLVSNYLNDHVKIGDRIDVLAPNGHFKVSIQDKKNNYFFFGAGSGITPLVSMIGSILEKEPDSHCHLLYGNRDEANIIFKSKLDRLALVYQDRFQVKYILSRPKNNWQGQTGRVDTKSIDRFLKVSNHPVDGYFICGPGAMIEAAYDGLLELGVAKDKVHREYFSAPLPKGDETIATVERELITSKVQVVLDKKQYDLLIDDETDIVHALLNKNIEPPYSCLSGTCSTCKAKLVEGDMYMDVSIGLEDDEKEAGYILTCQAHPLTESVKIDFDQ